MKTRFFCTLDGADPAMLDDCIALTDIHEHPPAETLSRVRSGGGWGSRVTARHRDRLQVTLMFLVAARDPVHRAAAVDKLRAWCGGRELRVSTRPEQQLSVICTALPAAGSSLGWVRTVTATFSAEEVPYWQARRPASARVMNETEGTVRLRPVGSAEKCPLSFRVWNMEEEPLQTLVVSANGQTICLTGLNAGSETVTAEYDEHGLLQLRVGSRSAMRLRTPESADELLLGCGRANTVTFQADRRVGAEFSARGWFV